MLQILTAPETIAFTAALVLMLAIGLVEALGLGASAVELDLGVHVDDGGLLGWLGIGRVPLLVLLIAFLAAFGLIGIAGQQLAGMLMGRPLPLAVALPGAAIASLPSAAILGRLLARIMPHDETTAIDVDELAGRIATLTVGRAVAGSPARARVVDPHGQAHNIFVEPCDDITVFEEGDTILLVRREGASFLGVGYDPPGFSKWIEQ